jgi:hypothetical protein
MPAWPHLWRETSELSANGDRDAADGGWRVDSVALDRCG